MKELSIEQKVKAYDEAIKVARSKIKNDKDHVLYEEDITDIFPELKESEDERIGKEIVNFINHRKAMGSITPEESKRTGSWIAWLEKQDGKHIDKELSKLLNRVICMFINNPLIPYSERDEVSKKIIPYVEQLEKQGEQKPILDVEIPFGAKDSELQEATYYIPKGFHAEIEGNNVIIKKGEQKPAWSEEDINMFGSILSTLGICANNPQIPADVRSIHKKEESWFNELYHRVQPKQEWSEEDEKYLKLAIDNFQMLGNSFLTAWLKSLKERYIWKPSDEQMFDLKCAADSNSNVLLGQSLLSLYNDLNKLKGE